MANPVFGALVSESGSGCCWYGNSQSNRLTPWNNDPISDASTEAIYIRDEDSGVFWTPTPLPMRELDAYRARHGQGYTEFEHNSHALEQTLMTFVPVHAERSRSGSHPATADQEQILATAAPVRHRHIRSSCSAQIVRRRRCISRPPGMRPRKLCLRAIPIIGTMEGGSHSLPWPPKPFRIPATALNSWAATARLKLRRRLRRVSLSNRTGPGLDPCGALQTKFELGPGQEKTVILVLGQADDAEHARRLIAQLRDPRKPSSRRSQRRGSGGIDLLTTIQVKTPVLSVDLMMNRWLLYQALSCRIWGRSALYQSSGAYGFRDQLQDALAFVYSAPTIAREHDSARRFAAVRRRRRAALVASAFRGGYSQPVLGRSAVASVRSVPIRGSHRRHGHSGCHHDVSSRGRS